PQPIYDELALQDGIHLPRVETRQQEGQRQVNQAMREAAETLDAEWTVREALQRAERSEFLAWPVCDSSGVIGVLSFARLRQARNEGSLDKPLVELVDARDFPHVHVDHPLHVALERMGTSRLDLLPVVSRGNVHQLRGVVTRADVLAQFGVEAGNDEMTK
ncbi:MAG TPA: CBS domain-containing protein, partial [Candidatus Acidoferrum sp.]